MKCTLACGLLLLAGIVSAQSYHPADPRVTRETAHLYRHMLALLDSGIMMGHQDDLAYGVGWQYEPGESDVKKVTGSYPAVFGWELGRLEVDSARNLDKVPFDSIRAYIRKVYDWGGINTFSWHFNNPVTKETAWSHSTRTVHELLPGAPYHAAYVAYLDRLAVFIGSLKGPKGEAIPLIYRPFHEHTGNWFWWGKGTCTPEEFIALWRFTVDYLRKDKHLHNLLLAYSAADFNTEAEYLERYPGNDYVDVLGFDAYCRKDIPGFLKDLDNKLSLTTAIAANLHKIPALTEVGYGQIPKPDWFTHDLMPVLYRYRVSYQLYWRNAGPEQYFLPYPGQGSADDFRQFCSRPQSILLNRLSPVGIYKN